MLNLCEETNPFEYKYCVLGLWNQHYYGLNGVNSELEKGWEIVREIPSHGEEGWILVLLKKKKELS